MRVEVFEECTVYDADGAVVARLPQQDVVAVRVTNGEARLVILVPRPLLERDGVAWARD